MICYETMASVKLLLDKGRTLKNDLFPLVFRILHDRRKRMLYTGYKLCRQEYSPDVERVIYLSDEYRTQKEVNTINRAIRKQRKSIDVHISELELLGLEYDVERIIFRYRIENDKLSLLGYIDKLIMAKEEIGKQGIALAYQSTRSSLSKFLGNQHLCLSKIDAILVKKYEHYLQLSGVQSNTICYYMRNFKSIYGQAISDGLEPPALSPFRAIILKCCICDIFVLRIDKRCDFYK